MGSSPSSSSSWIGTAGSPRRSFSPGNASRQVFLAARSLLMYGSLVHWFVSVPCSSSRERVGEKVRRRRQDAIGEAASGNDDFDFLLFGSLILLALF